MTFLNPERLVGGNAPASPGDGFGHARPAWHRWPLIGPVLGAIDRAFSDGRLTVSRPKVLFAASAVDFPAIFTTGFVCLTAVGTLDPMRSALFAAIVAYATVLAFTSRWIYTIRALSHAPKAIERMLWPLAMAFAIAYGTAAIAGVEVAGQDAALNWLGLTVGALALARAAVAGMIGVWARAGRLVRRTIIVGGGQDAEDLIAAFGRNGDGQLQILGLFDDREDERSKDSIAGVPKLGAFSDIAGFCHSADVDLVVVTVPLRAEARLLQLLGMVMHLPVEVRVSALNAKLRLDSRAYRDVAGVPMLAIMDRPLSDWDRVVKNLEDRVVGALLLLLAAPVMTLCAIAIRLDSRGPILFKQRRYGFNNELIEVYKFRSMYADQSDANAARLVTRGDPRVTRVGAFLRKSSLDELPQLFNVMRGEMSIVGPRPHATQAKADGDLYQAVVQTYFARHRVKPGITGWAQINGWRGETDTREKIEQRVACDLYYIDNWSLWLDLVIIARTPLSLVLTRNAY